MHLSISHHQKFIKKSQSGEKKKKGLKLSRKGNRKAKSAIMVITAPLIFAVSVHSDLRFDLAANVRVRFRVRVRPT